MAESNTEIANLAISHLGIAKEIALLETENSAEANACRRFYATTRDQVLRDYPWPFATKYAALTLNATNPAEIDQEWTYSYRYPSDCLRLRRIVTGVRPETRQAREPFKIGRDAAGELIYTNRANAEVEYTVREEDPTRFPPDFVQALALRLAAYIAPRITGGDPFKVGDRAMQMYILEITRAAASAENEESQDEDPDSEFIRARE